MSQRNFTESIVEEAALDWLAGLGYAILHGPAIAPGLGSRPGHFCKLLSRPGLVQWDSQMPRRVRI
jgi:hypothetical protein